MRNYSYIIVGFLILSVTSGVAYYFTNKHALASVAIKSDAAFDEQNSAELNTTGDIKNTSTRNTGSSKAPTALPKHDKNIEPPQVIAELSSTTDNSSLWLSTGEENKAIAEQYTDIDDGIERQFIEIGRLQIENLEKNTVFALTIPQTGSEFDAQVSDVIYHTDGEKTIKAVIASSDNERYSITITQGAQGTFGTLSTPDGVYVLEAGQTHGWIASKNDFVNAQNRNFSDEIHIVPDPSDIPPS